MNKQVTRPLSALIMASALFAAGPAIAASMADEVKDKAAAAVQATESFVNDATLTTQVKAALLSEKGLVSTDISVSTANGVVKLSGYVPDQKQAWRAAEITTGIKGVTDVNNELSIKGKKGESVGAYLSDAAITSKIKAQFLAATDLPSATISVKTNEGHVVLAGYVASKDQAARAVKIAKSVKDVKAVKNEMHLQ